MTFFVWDGLSKRGSEKGWGGILVFLFHYHLYNMYRGSINSMCAGGFVFDFDKFISTALSFNAFRLDCASDSIVQKRAFDVIY